MGTMVGDIHAADTSYAKAAAGAEESKAKKTGNLLQELKKQFSDLNIGVGGSGRGATFSSGLNNVSIAPNILKEMSEDPEARAKYEDVLNEIQGSWRNAYNLRYPGNGRRVYQEYFIMSDGEVGMMSISESGGSPQNPAVAKLPKDDKDSWLERIMKSIEERAKKEMEATKKTADQEAADALLNAGGEGHLDVRI